LALSFPAPRVQDFIYAIPRFSSDERVVSGLRTLVVDGYLSRGDLAPVLGPPGDLDLALRGVEPKRAGCA
jgi:hypothetical protein